MNKNKCIERNFIFYLKLNVQKYYYIMLNYIIRKLDRTICLQIINKIFSSCKTNIIN